MSNLSKALIIFMLFLIAGVQFSFPGAPWGGRFLVMGQAVAEESSWKDDFDSICGKTQDAMSLSPDELRALIKRCDELKVKVDALEGSARKVASKRLQMCRDLYVYVLEQKEKK